MTMTMKNYVIEYEIEGKVFNQTVFALGKDNAIFRLKDFLYPYDTTSLLNIKVWNEYAKEMRDKVKIRKFFRVKNPISQSEFA